MITHHSSIFLFEFRRYFSIFITLSSILWKLDTTLASIALYRIWSQSLWQLTTCNSSIIVHEVEIVWILASTLGCASNFVGMMGLLQNSLTTVSYVKIVLKR